MLLLTLAGPHDEMPVRLFKTEKAALKWCAENPPHPVCGHGAGDDEDQLQQAYKNGFGWHDNDPDTNKPFGYRLHRFNVYGEVEGYADVKPFHEYKLGDVISDFDVTAQTLSWSDE